jgi:autotransporter passenger strand-loop-strand repeat protein
VESGGIASGTTVSSGGEIIIYAGATVSGLVDDGGTVVSSGGFSPAVVTTQPTTSLYASAASRSATVESTVANLIQAMAGFHTGAGQGALFEPVSSGLLHEEAGMLLGAHRKVS